MRPRVHTTYGIYCCVFHFLLAFIKHEVRSTKHRYHLLITIIIVYIRLMSVRAPCDETTFIHICTRTRTHTHYENICWCWFYAQWSSSWRQFILMSNENSIASLPYFQISSTLRSCYVTQLKFQMMNFDETTFHLRFSFLIQTNMSPLKSKKHWIFFLLNSFKSPSAARIISVCTELWWLSWAKRRYLRQKDLLWTKQPKVKLTQIIGQFGSSCNCMIMKMWCYTWSSEINYNNDTLKNDDREAERPRETKREKKVWLKTKPEQKNNWPNVLVRVTIFSTEIECEKQIKEKQQNTHRMYECALCAYIYMHIVM